jgi:hypothetical protein
MTIDHTLQSNGSADISFEWSWGGADGDIDGFVVYVYQSNSPSPYTFGTSLSAETAYVIPANKRAFILFGVAADVYYTFGVKAYRSVDKDINSSGVISSAIVKPSLTEENPYRPSASIAFAGNITGTVNGIPVGNINVWEQISGSGKPANNATVGATFDVNINGQITPTNSGTYIQNGAITNLLIGNVIQSNSYNGVNAGWKIDKTGNIETFGSLNVKDTSGNIILSTGANAGVEWARVNNKSGAAGNMLKNSTWNQSFEHWDSITGWQLNHPDWNIRQGGANVETAWISQGTPDGITKILTYAGIPVIPGKAYEFSAYFGAHRCTTYVAMNFYDVNGAYISNGDWITYYDHINANAMNGGTALSNYKRCYYFAKAPANATRCFAVIAKDPTNAGQTSSYCFVTLPFFGAMQTGQTIPSDWNDGGGSTKKITSTSVGTYIESAAIGSAYISDLSADKITSGTLSASTNFQVGTAVRSGTTMGSGSGAVINGNGTFSLGNSSENITFDGSAFYMNGPVVSTGNLNTNAASIIRTIRKSTTTYVNSYWQNFVIQNTWYVVTNADLAFPYDEFRGDKNIMYLSWWPSYAASGTDWEIEFQTSIDNTNWTSSGVWYVKTPTSPTSVNGQQDVCFYWDWGAFTTSAFWIRIRARNTSQANAKLRGYSLSFIEYKR